MSVRIVLSRGVLAELRTDHLLQARSIRSLRFYEVSVTSHQDLICSSGSSSLFSILGPLLRRVVSSRGPARLACSRDRSTPRRRSLVSSRYLALVPCEHGLESSGSSRRLARPCAGAERERKTRKSRHRRGGRGGTLAMDLRSRARCYYKRINNHPLSRRVPPLLPSHFGPVVSFFYPGAFERRLIIIECTAHRQRHAARSLRSSEVG